MFFSVIPEENEGAVAEAAVAPGIADALREKNGEDRMEEIAEWLEGEYWY